MNTQELSRSHSPAEEKARSDCIMLRTPIGEPCPVFASSYELKKAPRIRRITGGHTLRKTKTEYQRPTGKSKPNEVVITHQHTRGQGISSTGF